MASGDERMFFHGILLGDSTSGLTMGGCFFFDSPPYDSDFVNFVKVYFMNYVCIYNIDMGHITSYMCLCV